MVDIMRIRGIHRVQRMTRHLRRRFTPKALILLYHCIAEKEIDPWELCVTEQHFAEHLEILRKHAQPVSLAQLVEAHRTGKIPNGAVAVTFDDGYANNLHNAKPLLEQFDVPATVFTVTGYLEKRREFWWDELERMLFRSDTLPEQLHLNLTGNDFEWNPRQSAVGEKESSDQGLGGDSLGAQSRTRLSLYYSIWRQLQPLWEPLRQKALDEISSWANGAPLIRDERRTLLPEELLALEKGGLVEVGAHSVTHTLLSVLPPAVQRYEIHQSKKHIEKILGHPVRGFAYPFGAYTNQTIPLVREAGFTHACSADDGTVWRGSDCFQFPRCDVKDWDGDQFAKQLSRWFRN